MVTHLSLRFFVRYFLFKFAGRCIWNKVTIAVWSTRAAKTILEEACNASPASVWNYQASVNDSTCPGSEWRWRGGTASRSLWSWPSSVAYIYVTYNIYNIYIIYKHIIEVVAGRALEAKRRRHRSCQAFQSLVMAKVTIKTMGRSADYFKAPLGLVIQQIFLNRFGFRWSRQTSKNVILLPRALSWLPKPLTFFEG